jgi:hypothetical protein
MSDVAITGRNPNGWFAKGNKIGAGVRKGPDFCVEEFRHQWRDAITQDRFAGLVEELMWCCTQRENLKVKKDALIYALDRCLGKPAQEMTIDVQSTNPDQVRLSAAQAILQRLEAVEDVCPTI